MIAVRERLGREALRRWMCSLRRMAGPRGSSSGRVEIKALNAVRRARVKWDKAVSSSLGFGGVPRLVHVHAIPGSSPPREPVSATGKEDLASVADVQLRG